MASSLTRRDLLHLLADLTRAGLLERLRPALALLPEFATILGGGSTNLEASSERDTDYASFRDAQEAAIGDLYDIIQFEIERIAHTSTALASMAGSPETVAAYLSRLQGGNPLLDFEGDVSARLRIGQVNVNVSRQMDLSATTNIGFVRVGVNDGARFSAGVGGNLLIASASAMSDLSQLARGTPNVRLSVGVGPARGYVSVQPGKGYYNIVGGLVRDFERTFYELSIGPFGIYPK